MGWRLVTRARFTSVTRSSTPVFYLSGTDGYRQVSNIGGPRPLWLQGEFSYTSKVPVLSVIRLDPPTPSRNESPHHPGVSRQLPTGVTCYRPHVSTLQSRTGGSARDRGTGTGTRGQDGPLSSGPVTKPFLGQETPSTLRWCTHEVWKE